MGGTTVLQHWGTADVSNFSTPGTLTSRAVTPEQPKGDSGGEPAVLPPGTLPGFRRAAAMGSGHALFTALGEMQVADRRCLATARTQLVPERLQGCGCSRRGRVSTWCCHIPAPKCPGAGDSTAETPQSTCMETLLYL